MKNFNMKLPVEKGPGFKAEPGGEPHGTSRKRPRSTHASGQGGLGNSCLGPLRPPSRAMPPSGWGSHLHCAPQIAIPDSRLHLTASNRPRSRFNSVRNFSYNSSSRHVETKSSNLSQEFDIAIWRYFRCNIHVKVSQNCFLLQSLQTWNCWKLEYLWFSQIAHGT